MQTTRAVQSATGRGATSVRLGRISTGWVKFGMRRIRQTIPIVRAELRLIPRLGRISARLGTTNLTTIDDDSIFADCRWRCRGQISRTVDIDATDFTDCTTRQKRRTCGGRDR